MRAVWGEWKDDKKGQHKHKGGAKAQDTGGLSQEQLAELQARLFEEARARTLSGPLPPAEAGGVVAATAVQQQQQRGPNEQPMPAQQQGPSESA
jgi:hypothetical protein